MQSQTVLVQTDLFSVVYLKNIQLDERVVRKFIKLVMYMYVCLIMVVLHSLKNVDTQMYAKMVI